MMKTSIDQIGIAVLVALCSTSAITLSAETPGPPSGASARHDYDIVYVRAPRYGDEQNTRWPEISIPIQMEPGADLMLLHPDGREEVLVKGGNGSVVDPYPSFDGEWIYYAYFHDLRPEALNRQRRYASKAGSDIYKIHVPSRKVVRLTHQEFTPNTGVAKWSKDPVQPGGRDETYLGYGIFNLGPCPLPPAPCPTARSSSRPAATAFSRTRHTRFQTCNCL